MLTKGSKAPDFSSSDHKGNKVSLSDFRGKKVILWFYPKANTPGCTAEGCSFRDLSSEFAQKNAVILGVSFDSAKANASFHEKFEFTFPLLCDTERTLGMAYGACESKDASSAKRIGVVIDEKGIVSAYYDKVSAKTWPTEVLATLT